MPQQGALSDQIAYALGLGVPRQIVRETVLVHGLTDFVRSCRSSFKGRDGFPWQLGFRSHHRSPRRDVDAAWLDRSPLLLTRQIREEMTFRSRKTSEMYRDNMGDVPLLGASFSASMLHRSRLVYFAALDPNAGNIHRFVESAYCHCTRLPVQNGTATGNWVHFILGDGSLGDQYCRSTV